MEIMLHHIVYFFFYVAKIGIKSGPTRSLFWICPLDPFKWQISVLVNALNLMEGSLCYVNCSSVLDGLF